MVEEQSHQLGRPLPHPRRHLRRPPHHSQDRPRTERMEALVDTANLATTLPGPPGRLWAERVAAIAGPAAVAQAREQLIARKHEAAKPGAVNVDPANCQPKPTPEVDVGLETAVGPAGIDTFIERVATWGRRMPRPGDPVFIRSASVAIATAGILPAPAAQLRLRETLGRIERSINPPEAATTVLTTEGVGL